jgi:Zn-dependent protease
MPAPPSKRRWSWQLGRLFGITIRVHATLIVLLLWVAYTSGVHEHAAVKAIVDWLLVISVFAVIVFHELAHALVARRFGCETTEIILLPIGGISVMERLPERPRHELLVALAGPAVNVGLAIGLAIALRMLGLSFGPEQTTLAGAVINELLWINVGLALFNFLPAFPMDGGRVLRALLAMRFGRDRATRIAATVGKVLAVGFVFAGLAFDSMLCFIGAFVWFAAHHESAMTRLSSLLSGATVGDAMIHVRGGVEADESIESVAGRMITEGHDELAVTEHGKLAGIVSASDLATRLAGPGPHGAIRSVMHRDVPVLAPTALLTSVLDSLERRGAALVADGDSLVGLLTVEQLGTYAALHARR